MGKSVVFLLCILVLTACGGGGAPGQDPSRAYYSSTDQAEETDSSKAKEKVENEIEEVLPPLGPNDLRFTIESVTYEGDAVENHSYKNTPTTVLLHFSTHDEVLEQYLRLTPDGPLNPYGLTLPGQSMNEVFLEEWTGWEDGFGLYIFGHEIRHCLESGIGQVMHIN